MALSVIGLIVDFIFGLLKILTIHYMSNRSFST